MRSVLFPLVLGLSSVLWLAACTCQPKWQNSSLSFAASDFSGKQMMMNLKFVADQPHPFGSPRQKIVGNYLLEEAGKAQLSAKFQEFNAIVPNPAASDPNSMAPVTMSVMGFNIFARVKDEDKPCIVLIGSHFDTKHIEGMDYYGANDSGSSSVVILEVLRKIAAMKDRSQLQCSFAAVWFDGEEAVLYDWYAGERSHPAKIKDNTYGSRHFADLLQTCGDATYCLPPSLGKERVVALLLLDMVGSPGLKISNESRSSPSLALIRDRVLGRLQMQDLLDPTPKDIEDDHAPFLKKGIPALNLIDFENMNNWHKPNDVISEISEESLVKSATLAANIIIEVSRNPKEIQQ